jgi:purine-nucleoside phosphorylase
VSQAADAHLDVPAAARLLQDRIGREPPDAVLVLGSGLSALVDAVERPVAVPFADIPGFPGAGVAGHLGRWVGGELEGRRVLVQAGRYHVYEGHPLDVVCAPVRVAAAAGARTLIVTNAAGGIRRAFGPGTLVRLTGHLDLMRLAPAADEVGEPYDRALGELAELCASELGIALERGVYAALTGPSYETPAEIRALGALGADVVGMSTVPEVIAARALGVRCLGISLVTNHAAGISPQPLDHSEVIEIGRRTAGTLEALLRRVVRDLPLSPRPPEDRRARNG